MASPPGAIMLTEGLVDSWAQKSQKSDVFVSDREIGIAINATKKSQIRGYRKAGNAKHRSLRVDSFIKASQFAIISILILR